MSFWMKNLMEAPSSSINTDCVKGWVNGWGRRRRESDANHDLCVADVVERVRVTRQLPKPISRPRDNFARKYTLLALEHVQVVTTIWVSYLLKSACRLPSQPTKFLLHKLLSLRLAGESRSALSGFLSDGPLIVRIPADSYSLPTTFSPRP